MFRPLTEKAWEDAAQELGKYLPKTNKTHLHEVFSCSLKTWKIYASFALRQDVANKLTLSEDHLTSELLKSIVRVIYKVRSVAWDFNAQKCEEVYWRKEKCLNSWVSLEHLKFHFTFVILELFFYQDMKKRRKNRLCRTFIRSRWINKKKEYFVWRLS